MDFFHPNVPITYYTGKSSYRSSVDINWTLDIDARSWGVKDLTPYIKDDVLKFTIKYDGEDGEEQEKEISLDIKYIDSKIRFVRSHGIWPVEIEVEENNGKVIGLTCIFTSPK